MFEFLTIIAVACFAVSGALKALQQDMEFFGAVVIALVTAVGGGTVRDVLLSRPIFWVHDPIFLHVGGAAATVVVLATRVARVPSHSLPITDALGLSLFAVIGAHTAYATGVPPITAILTGAMTGFVGGIVRDVLCGEVPRVLKQDVHATAAIAGAALFVGLRLLGVGDVASAAIAMPSVLAMRLVELRWGIHLPMLRLHPRPSVGIDPRELAVAGPSGRAVRPSDSRRRR